MRTTGSFKASRFSKTGISLAPSFSVLLRFTGSRVNGALPFRCSSTVRIIWSLSASRASTFATTTNGIDLSIKMALSGVLAVMTA